MDDEAVVRWLVDGDPAVRWQALRDLTGATPEEVAAARGRVTTDGWGAQLLAARDADGLWAGGGACFPANFRGDPSGGQPWTATQPSLGLLRELGALPDDPAVHDAVIAARDRCRWEHEGQAFFDGEVEPCINGRTVAIGAYFGVPVDGIVTRLLDEQLADGGWNCQAENGSVRSSFHSTICVLEGLLEYERSVPPATIAERVPAVRKRGEEYLLERALFRRLSTDAVVDPTWLEFAFPAWWHYDVLRGLDYFRAVGGRPDPRLAEAVELVRSKRRPDGTWLLDHTHPGAEHVVMETTAEPSRWNTLRALRVLAWWDAER